MAAKYNIAPEMMEAIIQQESGWNPQAQSPAGAQGLMQLMPGTARGLGVQNSMDPSQNMEGGAKYFSQMLKQFHNDPNLALAAYNAGPGRVQRSGGIPNIPETQNYVKSVMGNFQGMGGQNAQQGAAPQTAQGLDVAMDFEQFRAQQTPQAPEQTQTPAQSNTDTPTKIDEHWTKWLPTLGGTLGSIGGGILGGTAGSIVPGAGTAAGAVGGSALGAGAGGGLGEEARLLLNQYLYGEAPKSIGDNLKSVGKEALGNAATDLAFGAAGMGLKSVARSGMIKILKPSEAVVKSTNAVRQGAAKVVGEREIADTVLRKGLGLGEKGFNKASKMIGKADDLVQGELEAGGRSASKGPILQPMLDSTSPAALASSGTTKTYIDAVDRTAEELLHHPSYTRTVIHPQTGLPVTVHSRIPLKNLNRMKSDVYSEISKWGRTAEDAAGDEAKKLYAYGMRQQVEQGLSRKGKAAMAEMSELIPAREAINNASKRIAGANAIGWGDTHAMIAAAPFLASGTYTLPALAGIGYAAFRRPMFQTPALRGLYRAGQAAGAQYGPKHLARRPMAALVEALLNGQNSDDDQSR